MASRSTADRREHARYRVCPMYTDIEAMVHGPQAAPSRGALRGHAYDISVGGVRIELDEPLSVGQTLDLKMTLPGSPKAIGAAARVVWINDAHDDPGPRRMAVRLIDFRSPADHALLNRYLSSSYARAAA